MGWVAGPRLTAATAAAGGLGILASATMTSTSCASAIDAGQGSAPSNPFGVNLRADAADVDERVELLIDEQREGGELRPGAEAKR